ncbi:MAG: VWA domain-containing protein [Planctomycetes bacterium]|nr:VWA domain-containing protein [Planctomycetota bacterium]
MRRAPASYGLPHCSTRRRGERAATRLAGLLVLPLLVASCASERPARRPAPGKPAAREKAPAERIPYVVASSIECSGSAPYRAAGAGAGALSRQRVSPQCSAYAFVPAGLASFVDGQPEHTVYWADSPPRLQMRRDPATRRVTADGGLAGLAAVTTELLVRNEAAARPRSGEAPVALFPDNRAGLPTSVTTAFETIDMSLPTGLARVVSYRSREFPVPLGPGDARVARARFHGTLVMSPETKLVFYSGWEFEATVPIPDGGQDRLVQRAVILRTDALGQRVSSLVEGRLGRGPLPLPPARSVASAGQVPAWCVAPLWTARVALLSSATQAERDTNPLPIIAALAIFSMVDTAIDWGTNLYWDWEQGRPLNPFDGQGWSLTGAAARVITDAAGLDPKWADVLAAGTRIGIALATMNWHYAAGGYMAHAGPTVKAILRAILDIDNLTGDWVVALDLVELFRSLAALAEKPPEPLRVPPASVGPAHGAARTQTVLVLDTSGSMDDTWRGGRKLEAAVAAALEIVDIVEQESAAGAGAHQVGLVTFDTGAQTVIGMTSVWSVARDATTRVRAGGRTNLGAGLGAALDLLRHSGASSSTRVIILLSDGCSNVGLAPEQILASPVQWAAQAGIRIYTVGFGEGRDLDEGLLRAIAAQTGGQYAHASAPAALRGIYVRARHQALGRLLSERRGTIGQGETVQLASFRVPEGRASLHGTLQWPGSALDLLLTDPRGRRVTSSYPGASVSVQRGLAHVIVRSPRAGTWRAAAYGRNVPESRIFYEAAISLRGAPGSARPSRALATVLFLALAVVVYTVAGGAVLLLAVKRAGGTRPAGGEAQGERPGGVDEDELNIV